MTILRPVLVALAAAGLFVMIPACTVGEPDEAATSESAATSPLPGSSCSTTNEIASRACGLCGKQQAICLPDGHWSTWSPCMGEPVDACTPGTVEDGDACGNCGTMQRRCDDSCRWTAPACTDEGCVPGSVDFTSAGCATGYRRRDCTATCGYTPFGSCQEVEHALRLGAADDSDTTMVVLDWTQRLPRLYGTCPSARLSPTSSPARYVRVDNTSAQPMKVSLRTHSKTGRSLDLILAAYLGAHAPTADERPACIAGVADIKPVDAPPLDDAALVGPRAVRIEAGASIIVYVASWGSDGGVVELEAHVDALL